MASIASHSDKLWRALKHNKHSYGRSLLKGFSSKGVEIAAEDTTSPGANPRDKQNTDTSQAESITAISVGLDGIPENDEPLKRRIFKAPRRLQPLKRFKQFYRMIFPEPSAEERAIKREKAERKKLEALLHSEAEAAITKFHGVFRRMNLTEKPLANNRGNTGRVYFDSVYYNPNSIYLHIGKFPHGCNIMDFVNSDVSTNLSEAVRRNVVARFSVANGVIIRIDRNSSAGLPSLVTFHEALDRMASSLPPLSFPLGQIANGKYEYGNVDEGPHLLIGGETKGGKSNFLNVLIGSIVYRASPKEVRFLMVDLKGNGIELSHWENIPHLIRGLDLDKPIDSFPKTGIASFPQEALALLEYAAKFADDRMNKYTRYNVKNIDQWNRSHAKKRDFHLIFAIDELTMLTDHEPVKAKALLKRIAAIARAAGLHVVAALQTADKTNMTQNIKTNFPMRIAFSFQDVTGSTLMVGDSSAMNLEPSGRAIFKHGTRRLLVQTPFISNQDIANAVAKSMGKVGDIQSTYALITELDLIAWALSENGSSLTFSVCYNHFKSKIDQAQLKLMLKQMENKVYTLGEYDYTVTPGGARTPRTVVRAETQLATTTPS
jgi:DNA segregation ATPase FtsK/SpoIIIE-like protein